MGKYLISMDLDILSAYRVIYPGKSSESEGHLYETEKSLLSLIVGVCGGKESEIDKGLVDKLFDFSGTDLDSDKVVGLLKERKRKKKAFANK